MEGPPRPISIVTIAGAAPTTNRSALVASFASTATLHATMTATARNQLMRSDIAETCLNIKWCHVLARALNLSALDAVHEPKVQATRATRTRRKLGTTEELGKPRPQGRAMTSRISFSSRSRSARPAREDTDVVRPRRRVCEERRCIHFDGHQCNLASRIVQILPTVVDDCGSASYACDGLNRRRSRPRILPDLERAAIYGGCYPEPRTVHRSRCRAAGPLPEPPE